MTANTVYEVFLALSPEEREKFIVLVKGQEENPNTILERRKARKSNLQRKMLLNICLQPFSNPNTNLVIVVIVVKTSITASITNITNSYERV